MIQLKSTFSHAITAGPEKDFTTKFIRIPTSHSNYVTLYICANVEIQCPTFLPPGFCGALFQNYAYFLRQPWKLRDPPRGSQRPSGFPSREQRARRSRRPQGEHDYRASLFTAAIVEICKSCTLLHRSKLKHFAHFRRKTGGLNRMSITIEKFRMLQ